MNALNSLDFQLNVSTYFPISEFRTNKTYLAYKLKLIILEVGS